MKATRYGNVNLRKRPATTAWGVHSRGRQGSDELVYPEDEAYRRSPTALAMPVPRVPERSAVWFVVFQERQVKRRPVTADRMAGSWPGGPAVLRLPVELRPSGGQLPSRMAHEGVLGVRGSTQCRPWPIGEPNRAGGGLRRSFPCEPWNGSNASAGGAEWKHRAPCS